MNDNQRKIRTDVTLGTEELGTFSISEDVFRQEVRGLIDGFEKSSGRKVTEEEMNDIQKLVGEYASGNLNLVGSETDDGRIVLRINVDLTFWKTDVFFDTVMKYATR